MKVVRNSDCPDDNTGSDSEFLRTLSEIFSGVFVIRIMSALFILEALSLRFPQGRRLSHQMGLPKSDRRMDNPGFILLCW